MTDIERRYLDSSPVEFRAATSPNSAGIISGYAAKYGKRSHDLGGFIEEVHPAFFNKSLADNVDVKCRWQHQDDFLLGRTSSGTLVLRNDKTGLWYSCDVADTSVGRDVQVLAARKDITGSSFAFVAHTDAWGVTERGYPLRRLESGLLVDTAPVVDAAYPDATVASRSLAHAINADVADLSELFKRGEIATRLKPKGTIIDMGITTDKAEVVTEPRDDSAPEGVEERSEVLVSVSACVHTCDCTKDETEPVVEESSALESDMEMRAAEQASYEASKRRQRELELFNPDLG